VVEADVQYPIVREAIVARLRDVPTEFREAFVFHATDIWNNKAYRENWPQTARWDFLLAMMSIPRLLKAPIVLGKVRRDGSRASIAGREPCDNEGSPAAGPANGPRTVSGRVGRRVERRKTLQVSGLQTCSLRDARQHSRTISSCSWKAKMTFGQPGR